MTEWRPKLTDPDAELGDFGEPLVQSLPWWHEALDEGWSAEELVGNPDPSALLPWWQEALIAGVDPRY